MDKRVVTTHRLNHDYDFLVHFDVNSAIRSNRCSIDQVVELIKSSASEAQIREIIVDGIDSQFKKSNNFQIISNIHKHINQIILNNNHKHNNKSTGESKSQATPTPKVFQIQSLICSIFGYLDFQSLLTCSRVNRQWLYDSYNPASLTHIATNHLYKKSKHKCFYNLNRFKSVGSLKLNGWDSEYDDYFRNLEKFLNFSKLHFEIEEGYLSYSYNSESVIGIMPRLIENNKDKLQTLIISKRHGWSQREKNKANLLQCEFLESFFFPHLVTLRVRGIILQAFYLNNNNNNNNNDNFNSLQDIEMKNSHLSIGFWRDMYDDKSNLSNIKRLSFIGCKIDASDQELIESKYIPKIASKLNNLQHFECNNNQAFGTNNTNEPQLANILCSFLQHLSQNKKTRDTLKSLDIELTSQWFLQQCQVPFCIRSSGEFVCNFPNLENVSLKFDCSCLDLCKPVFGKHLDEGWIVEKALGTFCSIEDINTNKNDDDDTLQWAIDNISSNNGAEIDHDPSNEYDTENVSKHMLSVMYIIVCNVHY